MILIMICAGGDKNGLYSKNGRPAAHPYPIIGIRTGIRVYAITGKLICMFNWILNLQFELEVELELQLKIELEL